MSTYSVKHQSISMFLLFFLTAISPFSLFSKESEKINPHKFAVLTIPKSGTHLITRCVKKITNQSSVGEMRHHSDDDWIEQLEYYWDNDTHYGMHRFFSEELAEKLFDHNFKVIFMIRDPRDQTVSVLNWLLEGKWPNTLDPIMFTDTLSNEEKLHEVITGERFGFSTLTRYVSSHLGWMFYSHPNIHVVRFEDLVGSKGGGDDEKQLETILNIAKHIDVPLSQEQAISIAKKLFGNTNTFRRGQIGAWKSTFEQEHRDAFKQVFGQELIEMGYEQNFDW